MNPLYQVLASLTVPVVIIGLVIVAHRYLDIHPARFVELLFREFNQLLNRQWTTGSMNAAGLLAMFLFGFAMFAAAEVGHLVFGLAAILGAEKAHEFVEFVSLL